MRNPINYVGQLLTIDIIWKLLIPLLFTVRYVWIINEWYSRIITREEFLQKSEDLDSVLEKTSFFSAFYFTQLMPVYTTVILMLPGENNIMKLMAGIKFIFDGCLLIMEIVIYAYDDKALQSVDKSQVDVTHRASDFVDWLRASDFLAICWPLFKGFAIDMIGWMTICLCWLRIKDAIEKPVNLENNRTPLNNTGMIVLLGFFIGIPMLYPFLIAFLLIDTIKILYGLNKLLSKRNGNENFIKIGCIACIILLYPMFQVFKVIFQKVISEKLQKEIAETILSKVAVWFETTNFLVDICHSSQFLIAAIFIYLLCMWYTDNIKFAMTIGRKGEDEEKSTQVITRTTISKLCFCMKLSAFMSLMSMIALLVTRITGCVVPVAFLTTVHGLIQIYYGHRFIKNNYFKEQKEVFKCH